MTLLLILVGCSDPFKSTLEHGTPADLGPDWSIAFGSSEFEATDKKRVTTFDSFDEPYLYLHTNAGVVEGIDLVLPTAEDAAALSAAWGPPSSTAEVSELPRPDTRGMQYDEAGGTASTWMSADGATMATMWAAEDGAARVTLRPWWGLDRALAGVTRCESFPGLAEAPIRPGIASPKYAHDPAVHGPYLLPAVHPLDAGSNLEFYVTTIVWQVHDPEGVVEKAVRAAIEGLPEEDGRVDCPGQAGSIHLGRSGSRFDLFTRPFETPEERAERQAAAEASKPRTALEAAERQAIVTNCITMKSDYVQLVFGVKDGRVTSPRVYDIPTSFSNVPAPPRRRSDRLATCLIDEAKSWHFDPNFEEEELVMAFGARPM